MIVSENILATLLNQGINVCFANPGTTELDIVTALDKHPEIKCYLCLQENVVTGAAHGYAQIAKKPAFTLLHLGSGFSNGISNLHNAKKGEAPIINLVGDLPTYVDHELASTGMDIQSAAKLVSKYVGTINNDGQNAGQVVQKAWQEATQKPFGPVTIIIPKDTQDLDAPLLPRVDQNVSIKTDRHRLDAALEKMQKGKVAVIFGVNGPNEEGLMAAKKMATHYGVEFFIVSLPSSVIKGGGLQHLEEFPYLFPGQHFTKLDSFDSVFLFGTSSPTSAFGHGDNQHEIMGEGLNIEIIVETNEDVVDALLYLSKDLPNSNAPSPRAFNKKSYPTHEHLNKVNMSDIILNHIPENSVVVVEAPYIFMHLSKDLSSYNKFTQINLAGSALGQSIPASFGAAIAAPERPIICVTGDGSAAYTLQALWSIASENCNVTILVIANNTYDVLKIQMAKLGESSLKLMEMKSPTIDWVKLSEGYGVPAVKVSTVRELENALDESIKNPGPHLIQMDCL